MTVFKFVLVFYYIFGNAVLSEANLLDAVGGLIGLGNNENSNMNINDNQNILFRNGNNNYRPSNQFVPNQNYNNNNNRGRNNQFLPNINFNNNNVPNNNFGRPTNNPNNRPAMEQFKNPDDIFDGLTEEEREAAKQMPAIGNLLAKLREMNKQKELQKQRENGQNGGNNLTINNNANGNSNFNGNGINNGLNANNNNLNGKSAMNGWKVALKRKFAFQAKPVRPDNELILANDKVYYLD